MRHRHLLRESYKNYMWYKFCFISVPRTLIRLFDHLREVCSSLAWNLCDFIVMQSFPLPRNYCTRHEAEIYGHFTSLTRSMTISSKQLNMKYRPIWSSQIVIFLKCLFYTEPLIVRSSCLVSEWVTPLLLALLLMLMMMSNVCDGSKQARKIGGVCNPIVNCIHKSTTSFFIQWWWLWWWC